MKIVHYATAEQLARCYPLMRALRGRLADEAQFISRAQRQQRRVIASPGSNIRDSQRCWPVIACWRILSTAASATSMTGERSRAARSGLRRRAARRISGAGAWYGCSRMVLDTAISNTRAQAFYQRCGYQALGLHFYRSIV